MKKAVILLILLIPSVLAQLDWAVTDLRCGNSVLDKYELCEKEVEESRCDVLAEKLGIDMGCYDQHCTCVPRVNPVYCGNNRRDFNEMCDGTDADDKCGLLEEIMGNISLKCNTKTCGCDFVETIGQDYNPVYIEQLTNASQTASSCGDKKVERNEECDPPNTLCVTNKNEPGVCTEKCECIEPEMIGVEKTETVPIQNETVNATETNISIENQTITENATVEPTEEKPGFFGRIWAWIKGLFS